MRGRVALILLFVIAAAAAAFYFTRSSPAGERLVRIALEGEVATLDPTRIVEVFSTRVAGQIYEGLVTLDADNNLIPLLAEAWTPSETGGVWRFTIRRGVRFHPHDAFGTPRSRELTADDVVYSFGRMLAKGATTAGALAGIEGAAAYGDGSATMLSGVTKISETEVEIRLTAPDPYFVYRLTSPTFAVVPREIAELGPDVFGRSAAIGTGPFVFAGQSGTDITLTRNPEWWRQGDGNVDRVVFRMIREDQIRLTELRNGQIDLMHVPLALSASVLESGATAAAPVLRPDLAAQFAGISYPTLNSYFLGFNTARVDSRLRRAIASALDRPAIVAAVARGLAQPATGPVPLSIPGWEPAQADVRPNLDLARKELTGLQSPKLEILVHELVSAEQIGEVVSSQLAPLGIEVSLVRLGFNAVVDRVLKGDYTATVLGFEYQYATPTLILANHFTSAVIPMPNIFYYRSEAVDGQLASLQRSPEGSQTFALARQVEQRILSDAPAAFLFQTTALAVGRKDMAGLRFNGHNAPLLWDLVLP